MVSLTRAWCLLVTLTLSTDAKGVVASTDTKLTTVTTATTTATPIATAASTDATDAKINTKTNETKILKTMGIRLIEMFYNFSLVALVGDGTHSDWPLDTLILWDDQKAQCVGTLRFHVGVRLMSPLCVFLLFFCSSGKIKASGPIQAVRLHKTCFVLLLE